MYSARLENCGWKYIRNGLLPIERMRAMETYQYLMLLVVVAASLKVFFSLVLPDFRWNSAENAKRTYVGGLHTVGKHS